jgi:hypothetical protein
LQSERERERRRKKRKNEKKGRQGRDGCRFRELGFLGAQQQASKEEKKAKQ